MRSFMSEEMRKTLKLKIAEWKKSQEDKNNVIN